MKKLIRLETKNLIENYNFYDKSIKDKFYNSSNKWISDVYLYILNNKIVSFCMLMKENLEFGFLHYHISKHKNHFITSYPQINKKTNQIHFIYTSIQYRKQNIASELLNFVLDDLKNRDYHFVWLIDEVAFSFYNKFNFLNFSNMLKKLQIKEMFLKDYNTLCNFDENRLVNYFGDKRLVKDLFEQI